MVQSCFAIRRVRGILHSEEGERSSAATNLQAQRVGLQSAGSIAALQAFAALCVSSHCTQVWVACLQIMQCTVSIVCRKAGLEFYIRLSHVPCQAA